MTLVDQTQSCSLLNKPSSNSLDFLDSHLQQVDRVEGSLFDQVAEELENTSLNILDPSAKRQKVTPSYTPLSEDRWKAIEGLVRPILRNRQEIDRKELDAVFRHYCLKEQWKDARENSNSGIADHKLKRIHERLTKTGVLVAIAFHHFPDIGSSFKQEIQFGRIKLSKRPFPADKIFQMPRKLTLDQKNAIRKGFANYVDYFTRIRKDTPGSSGSLLKKKRPTFQTGAAAQNGKTFFVLFHSSPGQQAATAYSSSLIPLPATPPLATLFSHFKPTVIPFSGSLTDAEWDSVKWIVQKVLCPTQRLRSKQKEPREICNAILSYYLTEDDWEQIADKFNITAKTLREYRDQFIYSGILFAMFRYLPKYMYGLKCQIKINKTMVFTRESPPFVFDPAWKLTPEEQNTIMEGFFDYIPFREWYFNSYFSV